VNQASATATITVASIKIGSAKRRIEIAERLSVELDAATAANGFADVPGFSSGLLSLARVGGE